LSETFAPANFQREGFIYGKDNLLIPNPLTDKEGYEKATAGRVRVGIDATPTSVVGGH
jgi:NADH-quinone oxidoreductase subunit I